MKRRGKEGTCWDLCPWLLGFLASSHYAPGPGIGDCVQGSRKDGNAMNKDREYRRKHRFWEGVSVSRGVGGC